MTDALYTEFQNLLRSITPRQHKQKDYTWVAVEDPTRLARTRQYHMLFESQGPAPDRRLFNANMEEHECVLIIYTAYVDFAAHELDPVLLDDNTDILETISRVVNTQSIPGLTYIERDFPPGYVLESEDETVDAKSVHFVEHQFRFRYMRAR